MLTSSRCQLRRARAVIAGILPALIMAAGGCGNSPGQSAGLFVFESECDTSQAAAVMVTGELVTLDWDGGTTTLYPDEPFAALDLAAFDTVDGGTLADNADWFKERVRMEVTQILCDSPGPRVQVREADDSNGQTGTVVHLTQDMAPGAGSSIGEGEYDVCNEQHDNVALVFGEQIRRVGGLSTFEEWVHIFANVTAHEIGHTLGFGHVGREEFLSLGRSLFVELMLDGHTIDELRRSQRFVVEQDHCPSQPFRQRRVVGDAVITCGLAE